MTIPASGLKTPRYMELARDFDLDRVIDSVRREERPRILRRDGTALVAIVPLWAVSAARSSRLDRTAIGDALTCAGAWHNLDTDSMKRLIHEERHRRPRDPVDW